MMNGEKRQNQQPDRRGNRTILGRTIFLMGLFGVVIFIPLLVRLYDLQITNHEYYQEPGHRPADQRRGGNGQPGHHIRQ